MELINLVNSVIISQSQTTLPKVYLSCSDSWFTILIFWVCLFLLTLVFLLQWFPSIGEFRQCCCLSFHRLSFKFKRGCSFSSHGFLIILVLLGAVFVIIWGIFLGSISLNLVLLLLLLHFVTGSRVKLICISRIVYISFSLVYSHDFQLLVLLLVFLKIPLFVLHILFYLLYANALLDDVICTTPCCKCAQTFNLWQQLELVSELEYDPQDTGLQ